MVHYSNPYGTDQRASNAIDRKRQRERQFMLERAYKNSDELALRLVQRLVEKRIVETTAVEDIREVLSSQLKKLNDMEEFDVQFKIAPIRNLVSDSNFISLFITQYIIEDLINHSKVQDVFGDDEEIYHAVDSILRTLRM